MAWASASEVEDRFYGSTFAEYDFRIHDVNDNGEFITTAWVDLLVKGELVECRSFCCSTEFGPSPTAAECAASYALAWVEAQTYSFEDRLGPYGIEWEREMEERMQS
jgi:hypothetical protein